MDTEALQGRQTPLVVKLIVSEVIEMKQRAKIRNLRVGSEKPAADDSYRNNGDGTINQ